MFAVHTTLGEFENATITGHFGFVVEETRSGKSHNAIVFVKLRFQNVFRPRENEKPVYTNQIPNAGLYVKSC